MVACRQVLFVWLANIAVQAITISMFKGSKLGTTEYNLEPNVVKQGRKDFHRASLSTIERKELLCVTFLHPNTTAQYNFIENVQAMGTHCDWAVIYYQGTASEIHSTCSDTRVVQHIIHCRRNEETEVRRFVSTDHGGNGTESIRLSVPKTVMYHDLLPYLSTYKKVFLMDEDISLQGFNVTSLMEPWECALSPPPLIVQPLVAESNQYINYLNRNSWKRRDRSKIIASGVGIVEQQVPLFDSVFLEWFIRRVLSLTRDTALIHGVDWGHDRSWCNAARMYGKYVLNYPEGYTPCAVFPHATPIHHLNYRSMENKRNNRTFFEQNGYAVVQRYIDYFPTWVVLDVLGVNNPLDFRNLGIHTTVFSLSAECVAKRQNGTATQVGAAWPENVSTVAVHSPTAGGGRSSGRLRGSSTTNRTSNTSNRTSNRTASTTYRTSSGRIMRSNSSSTIVSRSNASMAEGGVHLSVSIHPRAAPHPTVLAKSSVHAVTNNTTSDNNGAQLTAEPIKMNNTTGAYPEKPQRLRGGPRGKGKAGVAKKDLPRTVEEWEQRHMKPAGQAVI
jgi:hypothetical protein